MVTKISHRRRTPPFPVLEDLSIREEKEGGGCIYPQRIIVLLGMMGAGKTTLGKNLSRLFRAPFLDLDREIEREAKKTIPQIFSQEGEKGFRIREKRMLRKVIQKYSKGVRFPTLVLAVGGGAPLLPENRTLLRRKTVTIVLTPPLFVLFRRVSGSERPLLSGKGYREFQELYLRRKKVYFSLGEFRFPWKLPPPSLGLSIYRAVMGSGWWRS
jgi:shikimate kinase